MGKHRTTRRWPAYCAACGEDFELKSKRGPMGPKVADGSPGDQAQATGVGHEPQPGAAELRPRPLRGDRLVLRAEALFHRADHRGTAAARGGAAGGWIADILLREVPASGKVWFVHGGEALGKEAVLEQWRSTLFLREAGVAARGWLIEVMRCVEAIGCPAFTLDDVYAFEDRLSRLYPGNNNVRPDTPAAAGCCGTGWLEFVGQGGIGCERRFDFVNLCMDQYPRRFQG